MDAEWKLEGFVELYAKLNELKTELALKALRGATAAGAQVVRDEAKQRVPVDTGTLKRSLYVKWIREGSSAEKQTFYVGVRQGKKFRERKNKKGKTIASTDAYYGRFVEFGHFTRQPGGKRLRNTGKGQRNNAQLSDQVQSGVVRWVQAKPFLLPAFDSRKQAAIDAMKARLMERIAKYAR